MDPLSQRTLNDRFTILEPIGSGGMGKVYRAVQAPLGRVVALKVLDSKYANGKDPEFRKRFFLEAALTARLRHPNTITVIDYGQTRDGIFYIVMEYLEGQTLSQHLARSGPLPWLRCLNIAQQVCRSLREAHKLGVIHRDLKPANVMLLSEDQEMDLVKVLDFGLVKSIVPNGNGQASAHQGEVSENGKELPSIDSEVTHPGSPEVTLGGMFVGSPQYMAPEQARNKADNRSDIYALGATLYHMMSGRPPFLGKDAVDIIFKHINEPVPFIRSIRPDLEVPPEAEAVLLKCLEKQPLARFQSMDEVLEAIRRAAMASGGSGFFVASPGAALPNGVAVTPPPMPTFEGPSPFTPPPSAEELAAKETTLALDISVVPSVAPLPAAALSAVVPSALPPPDLKQARLLQQKWPVVVGGATLLGLVLAIALWLSPRGSKPLESAVAPPRPSEPVRKLESSVATQKAPVQPSPKPEEKADQAPKRVKFRVLSEPSGATVSMGKEVLGVTPLTFDVPGDAQGIATAKLVFSLRGYQSVAVTTGGSGEIVLSEKLQSKPSGRSGIGSSERVEVPVERPATVIAATEARPPPEPTPKVAAVVPETKPPPESEQKVAAVTPTPSAPVGGSPPPLAQAASITTRPPLPPPVESAALPQGPVEFNENTMTAPVKASGPDPEYTQRALDKGIEGQMLVRCRVTVQGSVTDCRVLKGLPFMDRAVMAALERRTYVPAISQGKAVEVYYTFRLTLKLPH